MKIYHRNHVHNNYNNMNSLTLSAEVPNFSARGYRIPENIQPSYSS